MSQEQRTGRRDCSVARLCRVSELSGKRGVCGGGNEEGEEGGGALRRGSVGWGCWRKGSMPQASVSPSMLRNGRQGDEPEQLRYP